jgi:hypothetical protein
MVDPAMCCQNSVVDYTIQDSAVDCIVQERKRKSPEMYCEAGTATHGVEPSDIMVLFPLLLL